MKTKMQALPALNESCDICRSPQRLALLSMKGLGATMSEIAEAGNFTAAAVEQHFSEHVTVSSGTDDANIDQALTDAQELFFAATLSGNFNAAAAALSCRTRLLDSLARRRKDSVKQENMLGKAVPGDVRTYPPELTAFVEAHFNSILERVADYEATL